MKQNSDMLWYPIQNVDTQFTKQQCIFIQWPEILIWRNEYWWKHSSFSSSDQVQGPLWCIVALLKTLKVLVRHGIYRLKVDKT